MIDRPAPILSLKNTRSSPMKFLPIIALALLSSIAAAAPVTVDLSGVANVWAIATEGKAVQHNGLDSSGNAYSASLLSTSLTWSGTTFKIGAPDVADAVANLAVPLPAGNYTALQLLATGSGTNQPSQKFLITYADGSTATVTQSVSDWWTPQSYPGEAVALVTPHRVTVTGVIGNGNYSLYGYSLPLDATKSVKSLTLPANTHVTLLGAALLSAAPTSTATVPTVATVSLTWSAPTLNTDGSLLTDLTGFNVYQGTSSTNLVKVGAVLATGGSYTTPTLPPGTYYYAVSAVNSANLESALSPTVSTVLAPPPPKVPAMPSNVKITVTVTAGP